MANEAIIRDRFQDAIDFTCADGTGIEKGAILKLTDPRTASLADGSGNEVAGVCAREKIASDGRTRVAVYRSGIFDMVASGAVAIGKGVTTAGTPSNTVKQAAVNEENILGMALEAASDGETFQVELKPFSVELA
jgi:predicted RecA/RadA family phage recombinase